MLPKIGLQLRQLRWAAVLGVALCYLLFFFPFAYFRHDDWFILGNSAIYLPEDWTFLWRPTLYEQGVERVWFFRPIFKLLTWLFFTLFKFHYWLWLTTLLFILLLAILITQKFSNIVSQTQGVGTSFLLIFLAWVPIHFGSVIWAGEGLMNIPLLFLLSVQLFAFAKGQTSRGWYFVSLFSFLLALGCKEAAVFHLPFLTSLFLLEPHFSSLSFKRKCKKLIPFFVLTGIYLVIRLVVMPVNPKYTSQNFWPEGIEAMLFFLAVLGIPWLFHGFFHSVRELVRFGKGWLYFASIFLAIAPYLGHAFLSPGWFLLPGYYLALLLPLISFKGLRPSVKVACGLLLISLIICGTHLWRIGWFQWHLGQRQIQEIVLRADENSRGLIIYDCSAQRNLRRVVGFEDSLYELWQLYHRQPIQIDIRFCEDSSKVAANSLVLRWNFPSFQYEKVPIPFSYPTSTKRG